MVVADRSLLFDSTKCDSLPFSTEYIQNECGLHRKRCKMSHVTSNKSSYQMCLPSMKNQEHSSLRDICGWVFLSSQARIENKNGWIKMLFLFFVFFRYTIVYFYLVLILTVWKYVLLATGIALCSIKSGSSRFAAVAAAAFMAYQWNCTRCLINGKCIS